MEQPSPRLLDHFASLTDPRRREPVYPLSEMVGIAVGAVLAGADDFVAIAEFARTRIEWFRKFIPPENGVPSHDRFHAVFAALKPSEFAQCLTAVTAAFAESTKGRIVAINGKTLRRSYDAASSKAAIHMVSAWAVQSKIVLGQQVTDAKSNEITAIPKLLRLLEVSGALVTIEAQGCQTEIAQQIVDQGGDYCLAVKGNQECLHREIHDFFADHLNDDFCRTKVRRERTEDREHGRVEEREYFLCKIPEGFESHRRFAKVKVIGLACSVVKRPGKPDS